MVSTVAPIAAAAGGPVHVASLYRAVTAHEPDEYSVLRLRALSPTTYQAQLKIVAPNRTHHTGLAEGVATLSGGLLVLRPYSNELARLREPQNCEISIRITEGTATVLSEDACAGYHGAAASFVEQGQALLATEPNASE